VRVGAPPIYWPASGFIYTRTNYRDSFVLQVFGSVDALGAVLARKHRIMPSLPRPILRSNTGLTDPRSTGSAPPPRVRDISAVRGTMKTRS
jgi:hypothetical protein